MFKINLEKVEYLKIISLVFFITATILSPFHFIFEFVRPVFEKYNLLTLLTLSMSIGVTYFIFMTFLITLIMSSTINDRTFLQSMIIAGVSEMMCIYSPIILLSRPGKIPSLSHALDIVQLSAWTHFLFIVVILLGTIILRIKNDKPIDYKFNDDDSWKDKPGM